MAKQPQRNKPQPPVKRPTAMAAPVKTTAFSTEGWSVPAFFTNIRLQSLLVFAFAFLLYVNTLTHGFVQDDAIVITDNMFTQQGVKGIPGILTKDTFFGYFKVEGKAQLVMGGRYRPFTLILFALVYQLAGPSTFAFHLLTVLLFAATCLVFYRLLLTLFKPQGEAYAALVAWIAAILFAAHPIHTEAVANVKGCDEIVTLLACLGALWLVVRSFDAKNMTSAWLAAIVFFAACLSKENAAAFVPLVPAALWFFRGVSWRDMVKYSLPVWIAFAVFFIVRGGVLDWQFGRPPAELMNNPYLKIQNNTWVAFTFTEKMATVMYTLGKYVLLLLVPHPLTHDYYPRHIDLMTFGKPAVLASVALYGFLAWYAISAWKNRDAARFGVLWYLLALSIVSNVVFPIGTNMGERFAFMPSAGFCITAAVLLGRLVKPGATLTLPLGIAGTVALLFALKTVTRNPVWVSNDELFLTDVANSPNSAKIQNACAGTLFDRAMKLDDKLERDKLCQQSIVHANKALEIYPNYSSSMITRGNCYFHLGNYDAAIADYREAIRIEPDKQDHRRNLQIALSQGGKYYGEQKNDLNTAMKYLTEAWQIGPDVETARLLGVANGIQGKHADALAWFEKAYELAPNDAAVMYTLGTMYAGIGGNPAKGNALIEKARQINPNVGK
jgi:protein O-mannosyl-transferase